MTTKTIVFKRCFSFLCYLLLIIVFGKMNPLKYRIQMPETNYQIEYILLNLSRHTVSDSTMFRTKCTISLIKSQTMPYSTLFYLKAQSNKPDFRQKSSFLLFAMQKRKPMLPFQSCSSHDLSFMCCLR